MCAVVRGVCVDACDDYGNGICNSRLNHRLADLATTGQLTSISLCGSTGGRRLLLQGGTLLHVAVEFGNVEAARLLLDRGADVNARATVDDAGVGEQPAIFHTVTQFGDKGLPMAQLLVERGADVRCV